MDKNPSKVNRPVGRPEMLRAVITAQGPGMADTGMPASAHCRDVYKRQGVYHMGFDVVNLSDVEQAYTLDVCTLTESATGLSLIHISYGRDKR